MSWWFMFFSTCHGGSWFFNMSWWFMCFHVGGSCDVHVMVVPVFSHAMVVHACYIKSFRFMFFTCHGGSCSFSCHGGSCFLTGHAGSCYLHVIYGGCMVLTSHGGLFSL